MRCRPFLQVQALRELDSVIRDAKPSAGNWRVTFELSNKGS